jgi:hypothetical protein
VLKRKNMEGTVDGDRRRYWDIKVDLFKKPLEQHNETERAKISGEVAGKFVTSSDPFLTVS